ncbi:MAG: membrane integrity-associated transporter subunit PqiC [Methylococcaceae bacterium]|nr:membrane integrity-associated transporter subunit PqiC [Methylococcaceae bacterium]
MQKLMLAALALILLSCSSTAPTQFYTLDAVITAPVTLVDATQKSRVIGIGPIALPALLNRRAIVTRSAQQGIQVADTQQWAEPLLDNITRVIARNIGILKPKYILHAYPWTAFGQVDTRVVIEVTQFETHLGKAVYFEAVWSIRDERLEKTLLQGQSKIEQPLTSQDTAEMVAKMNIILAAFSTELARALQ